MGIRNPSMHRWKIRHQGLHERPQTNPFVKPSASNWSRFHPFTLVEAKMWRFIRKNPYWLPSINATSNSITDLLTRLNYCTSQTQKWVQEISDILCHKNWKFLMGSSDIPKKLNPDVIRSVIRHNRSVDPKRLLDFFIWSKTKVGTLKDLEVVSILVVSLCIEVLICLLVILLIV